ncbi:hypothetical protein A3F07_03900 [candidate division WWE3 bacterium RIFCSPHIGHO2_12_FULL_38_15]|uniref:Uncharacterized protein n=1 Tax=candidate division WWE3 bacterium RIFCSPHIGHO2_02_FULL_38_14 TaxID=1802620 RepID=A0A1F4V7S3_UNCKA|nr:MAG: hypothetical protein A3F07_03900 [candidate division WWE3 bacterium RIFCSPHIGHO2_12_FULL_38_15]OGC53261.1 MAG: hypothetical protein A3D91_02495 [candidate division WWE3 bacterium RIFCSPHIGHO2_02_FULL_38_14]
MSNQINSLEMLSLILFIGVVTSLIVRRKTGINPGGIITAPFLVLSFYYSFIWGVTLIIISLLIYKIYNKYLHSFYYGRTPMYIYSIMSVLFVYAIAWIYGYFKIIPDFNINFVYGLILPAILTVALRKQGVRKTMIYTAITVVITALVSLVIFYISNNIFQYNFYYMEQLRASTNNITLSTGFILFFASIISSYVIYYFTKIKSGGYIVLPFLALLLFNPKSLLIFVVTLIFMHLLFKAIRHYTLIVGITRYTFVLCTAILVVWVIESAGLRIDPTFSPFLGANIFPALALASITNDFSVQKARNTAPMLILNLIIVGIVYFFVR